jgi:hypothetical protein
LNHHFSPQLVHAHKKIYITPATSQTYIWPPGTNKLHSLNYWYYSMEY